MKIGKLFILVLASICCCRCKQVETLTPNQHFYLTIFKAKITDSINVDIVAGNAEIVSTDNGNIVFEILLSEVRGGYSDFLGNYFNMHDGMASKRIKLIKNGLLHKELSYQDVVLLSTNKVDSIDNFYLKL